VICKKPFRKGGQEYPCGQCLPCRINRRRLWTHRLLLEQRSHEWSSFWTLTYDQEHYPINSSLQPKDTTKWLKRLRDTAQRPLRYYLVGEYGDQTNRAHYHVALFGIHHAETQLVTQTWGQGFCHGGELNPESAAYLAGYVTKKMTSRHDPRLNGRHPEFARMSRHPGIGALAVPVVASALNSKFGAQSVAQSGDVPTTLVHGRSNLPLGRYLRRKLREELGFNTVGGQEKPEILRQLQVQAMCNDAGSTSAYLAQKSATEKVKILQAETRHKIWSKKGKL